MPSVITRGSVLVAAVAMLAGCGTSTQPSTAAQPTAPAAAPSEGASEAPASSGAESAAAAAVPDRIKQAGVLNVGTTLPNLPYLLTDADNNITGGITPDVGKAVAAKLGLKYTIQNVAWEALLPGVAGGRYDMADDGISDTAERQKIGYFVDYMQSSQVLVTSKDKAGAIKTLDDVCGKKVAAIRGTTDVQVVEEAAKKCTDQGKPAAQPVEFPTAQDADLALRSGRVDVEVLTAETAKYAVSQGSPVAIVAEGFAPTYVGMFVAKKDKALADALLVALKELKADGTLDRILGGYGLKPVDEPGINLATS
ncbi:ABC transporter substrate-binding protein [Streptosporangium carneum]|uniref:ABC transporter substrate-binding protein n=1 Tax=Streptosporangium carneum TaxID=47481 RepID=A0A9W6I3E9_9ACTN|nr:ABC transporter substrate-binding protein [Streptosporangium carneum]GLK11340.1 ABC transporter substrate-binding protein [Streptosporangium carneum]